MLCLFPFCARTGCAHTHKGVLPHAHSTPTHPLYQEMSSNTSGIDSSESGNGEGGAQVRRRGCCCILACRPHLSCHFLPALPIGPSLTAGSASHPYPQHRDHCQSGHPDASFLFRAADFFSRGCPGHRAACRPWLYLAGRRACYCRRCGRRTLNRGTWKVIERKRREERNFLFVNVASLLSVSGTVKRKRKQKTGMKEG